jgi:hypothetical protein
MLKFQQVGFSPPDVVFVKAWSSSAVIDAVPRSLLLALGQLPASLAGVVDGCVSHSTLYSNLKRK